MHLLQWHDKTNGQQQLLLWGMVFLFLCSPLVPSRYFSSLTHSILQITTILRFSRQDFGFPFSIQKLWWQLCMNIYGPGLKNFLALVDPLTPKEPGK